MANQFRPKRMAKRWDALAGICDDFTAGETFLGSGSLNFDEAWTVMRMMGEYVLSPTSAPAVGDRAVVTIAIGVFSTDAIALGFSAMPDPNGEPSFSWLYYQTHALSFSSVDPESASAAASVRYNFDVKTMRKIKPREGLTVVGQYVDVNGAPPITYCMGSIRVLVAE